MNSNSSFIFSFSLGFFLSSDSIRRIFRHFRFYSLFLSLTATKAFDKILLHFHWYWLTWRELFFRKRKKVHTHTRTHVKNMKRVTDTWTWRKRQHYINISTDDDDDDEFVRLHRNCFVWVMFYVEIHSGPALGNHSMEENDVFPYADEIFS